MTILNLIIIIFYFNLSTSLQLIRSQCAPRDWEEKKRSRCLGNEQAKWNNGSEWWAPCIAAHRAITLWTVLLLFVFVWMTFLERPPLLFELDWRDMHMAPSERHSVVWTKTLLHADPLTTPVFCCFTHIPTLHVVFYNGLYSSMILYWVVRKVMRPFKRRHSRN